MTAAMTAAIQKEQDTYDQYRKLSVAFCNTQTDIKIGASKMILDERYSAHCAISAALQVWFKASDDLEKLKDSEELEKAEAFKRELAKIQTYVIHIPDCSGSYARFDFEAGEWWSTNDPAKCWTTDELTADDAEVKFRDTFGVLDHDWVRAELLTEAIEEHEAAKLLDLAEKRADVTLSHLKWTRIGNSITIRDCSIYAKGEFIIPAVIDGLPVFSIDSYAFYGCSGLTSVTFPISITDIGYEAFLGCTGLTSVTLPSSITDIGDLAFYGCTGLTSVIIPDSVTYIGREAFHSCIGLTSVTLPIGIISLLGNEFDGCTALTSVIFPSTLKDWTFSNGTLSRKDLEVSW